ncbi:hypothetical protein [Shewanella sp. SM21]|uniref:GapS4b family protein n=1 Tax=Shewanella sp. SM21 TaxID=2912793 RepID=UPI0021DA9A32|nr:hypothetical protein [Shewanella sp. SM21]MCU8086610.1 hypothetical protein [Shewanella sp. SM21]
MNKVNLKEKLLFGNSLRDLLNDSNVTASTLRRISRKRGIFICNNEKSEYVQSLVSTGISPSELAEIIDTIITKEENPKYQSQIIKCTKKEFSLINIVPTEFNLNTIAQEEFSNYKIIGIPSFKAINNGKEHIELNFSIERFQMTNSSYKNITEFNGKVIIKKEKNGIDVKTTTSHSSVETKLIANKIVSYFLSELKKSGIVNEREKLITIRFNSFTNKNRVAFLNELSQRPTGIETLYFKDTKDIGFKPEQNSLLPNNISWMQDNVSNMALQGKKLHSTLFFKEKKYHEHIQLYKVVAFYHLDNMEYKGTCNIIYDFNGFISKEDPTAELVLSVNNLNLSDFAPNGQRCLPKGKVIQSILSEIESYKHEIFEKFKIPSTITPD